MIFKRWLVPPQGGLPKLVQRSLDFRISRGQPGVGSPPGSLGSGTLTSVDPNARGVEVYRFAEPWPEAFHLAAWVWRSYTVSVVLANSTWPASANTDMPVSHRPDVIILERLQN